MKFLLFSILLSIGLISCTENENPPWSEVPVPVVFSILTPNCPAQVYLGKSYTDSSRVESVPYPEARVYIRAQDSAWVELKRSATDSTIFIDKDNLLPVIIGKNYSLRIELSNTLVSAETTIPGDPGLLLDVDCVATSSNLSGNNNAETRCNMRVSYKLPMSYSCRLTAFSNNTAVSSFLDGDSRQINGFTVPSGSRTFNLNLITLDSNFKKFMLAEYASSSTISDDDFTTVLSAFGGVRPNFSNIQHGVGLFGSCVVNSRMVFVKSL